MFTSNVGNIDRIVRVVLGLGLLSLFYFIPDSPWRWLGLGGVVLLLTSTVSWCPIYAATGLSTRARTLLRG